MKLLRPRLTTLFVTLFVTIGAAALTGCVVYEPLPANPGPSRFDRAWSAALGGAQDAGLFISAAEPSSGVIKGFKEYIEATITVARQADGTVRVQFDARDPGNRDPGLGNRFSEAYERRMGR